MKIITMTFTILKKKKGYQLIKDNFMGEQYIILDKDENPVFETACKETAERIWRDL